MLIIILCEHCQVFDTRGQCNKSMQLKLTVLLEYLNLLAHLFLFAHGVGIHTILHCSALINCTIDTRIYNGLETQYILQLWDRHGHIMRFIRSRCIFNRYNVFWTILLCFFYYRNLVPLVYIYSTHYKVYNFQYYRKQV